MYNSNDWPRLRDEIFGRTRYNGAFSKSWPRWWSNEVTNLFEEISSYTLSSLDAQERVSALIDRTGLTKLTPAEPIKHNNSHWYWTICEVFRTPLDPAEGFKLASGREPLAWQDYDYVSLEALLEEKLTTDLDRSLHPDEVERYKLIRDEMFNTGTE